MLGHLLNLLFIASSAFKQTTYNLTTNGTSWLVAGFASPNPDIIAYAGERLIFDVTGLNSTVFAIHQNAGSTMARDRWSTIPPYLNGSGTLICDIPYYGSEENWGGYDLYYEDESNPTYGGIICIASKYCVNKSSCAGPCTACIAGFVPLPTSPVGCAENMSVACPSPLPDPNCDAANCWRTDEGVEAPCAACKSGYFISAFLNCSACSGECEKGHFVSSPCGGSSDRVCSPCLDNTTDCNNGTAPYPSPSPSGSPPSTCPPPPNCKITTCWTATEVQCTECNTGYFINTNFNSSCSLCSQCSSKEYISWPCEGYTDTVCSRCYSRACHPCQVGYAMDLNGACVAQLCLIYGCGAANVDATCQELDSSNFFCICPGENPAIVSVNGTDFAGCSSDINSPPPVEEIIARINATHLEAFLINSIENVLGAALVNVNGNSFTLNITATIPIYRLTLQLQKEIAKFLGGNFAPADVTINFVGRRKKRTARSSVSNGEVTVTVQNVSGSASSISFRSCIIISLLVTLLSLLD